MLRITVQVLALALTTMTTACAATAPCSGVKHSPATDQRQAWAASVANQLRVPRVDVLEVLQSGGWSVVYVDTHQADEAFLFYSRDPAVSGFLTLWSGAAIVSEEKSYREWALKNAPGIPGELAECFAWYVTHGRKFQ